MENFNVGRVSIETTADGMYLQGSYTPPECANALADLPESVVLATIHMAAITAETSSIHYKTRKGNFIALVLALASDFIEEATGIRPVWGTPVLDEPEDAPTPTVSFAGHA